ncbi:RNA polymerase, sigma 28 subunit, FliA/WhiG subfamily [Desulfotomaculum nigrificans CO-1-SRB]|uniref:RNA polymerase sigma factor n=1 Tax=Desulfotomaculum nigrificans (strain DSM 14880 / VKM B-2319 / CO-1-SRB) TaxID=868595 RepID=F6BA14_DESCC|nr:RNA polymerase sporulation sigma factor SigK [Desulfotomaculum nigrificans]AEF94983.1 RNA polymerase, sigma 28 subunit, FliA/WhiG subfamily [Desulfotomaculum nigrificans CO-1-SRB]
MSPGLLTLIALSLINGLIFLVSYLSSGRLPDPLSAEEEQELLSRLQQGDQPARSVLVERNLRLVATIANKHKDRGIDKQDLFQVGVIGLIKAVNTFNPARTNKFATYAGVCIENEMRMMLRKNKDEYRCLSLSEPLDYDKEGNPLELQDTLMADDVPVDEQVVHNLETERLGAAMQKLTPRERVVINLRFGLNGGRELTQREVGKQLNISRSFISRIESKSISKLGRELANL